jgi:hypothetical protein
MVSQTFPLNNTISAITSDHAKTWALVVTALPIGYFVIRKLLPRRVAPRSRPPGPPREFLIGSLRSFPKTLFLERFCEWAEIYGAVFHLFMNSRSLKSR